MNLPTYLFEHSSRHSYANALRCRSLSQQKVDDWENYYLISSILDLGINTFVCLQLEYVAGVPEASWRAGQTLRPYFQDADAIQQQRSATEPLSFVHFPIRDCDTVEDDSVLQLCRRLVEMVRAGHRLYVHCWGGHGRTGTVVCIMLHLMYQLNAVEAIRRCQFVHDLRRVPIDVGSPQTPKQRAQVSRIVNQLISERTAAEAILAVAQQPPLKSDETMAAVPTGGAGGAGRGPVAPAAQGSQRASGLKKGRNPRAGAPSIGNRKYQSQQASRLKNRRAQQNDQTFELESGLVAIGLSRPAQQQQPQPQPQPPAGLHSARRPANTGPTRQRQAQNRRIVQGAAPAIPLRSS